MRNVVDRHIQNQTCVIVPAFNEGARILATCAAVHAVGFSNVLVIDDGSTVPVEASDLPHCTIIRHPINRGQGAAIQTGLIAALMTDAQYIITIDGDGQFDPENIADLLPPLISKKTDIVIGNRFLQKNTIPLIRRLYNSIAKGVAFLLTGLWVGDSQSGFKAFSREAAQKIHITTNGYEFCTEIIREIRTHSLRFQEIPVHVLYSKETMKKGQNFAGGVTTIFKLVLRSLMN